MRNVTQDNILQGLRELRARNVLTQAEMLQAHVLLGKDEITPEERYSAWKILSKYPKKLEVAGIDFFSIPEPEIKPKEVDGYRGSISLFKDRFVLKFDYDYFLIEIIKKLGTARYKAENKTWSVPVNQRTKHFVYSLVKKDNFYCTPAINPIIEEIDKKYKELSGVDAGILHELVDAIEQFLDHEADDMPIYIEYKDRLLKVLEKVKEN